MNGNKENAEALLFVNKKTAPRRAEQKLFYLGHLLKPLRCHTTESN
jgi:hypothetical protein